MAENYPVIEILEVQATLTPDGWQCADANILAMLEIDRKLYKDTDYHPYPLNAEAEAEAKRWPGGKVVSLMPVEENQDGLIY